ncbi:MAG: class II glutamine amidotransferase [Jhaorihella sp.]
MCELVAMSASEPVRVRYDPDSFAREGGALRRNPDGSGIVFAEDRDARWFREAGAAHPAPRPRRFGARPRLHRRPAGRSARTCRVVCLRPALRCGLGAAGAGLRACGCRRADPAAGCRRG